MTAEKLINLLNLKPLPEEGGFYRETYRAKPNSDGRSHSTAIYYLITPDSFSALHRVPQDEVFHFYAGDPVEMIQITEAGVLSRLVIGRDFEKGEVPQVVVNGSTWQGTKLLGNGKWALLGCTVAPGFEFTDFEVKDRNDLSKMFPRHASEVARFTH